MKTKKLTVESLRKAGCKVSVLHERLIIPDEKEVKKIMQILKPVTSHIKKGQFKNIPPINLPVFLSQKVSAKGGSTKICIDTKNGKYYQSESFVNPNDHFCKRRGVLICLQRIFAQAAENGEVLI